MSTLLTQPKVTKARTATKATSRTLPNVWGSFAKSGNYRMFFDMRPIDRAGVIKSGVPASVATKISKDMGFPRDRVVRLIGVPPATANRKLAQNADFSSDEGERIVGLTKLIGQVETIVRESGDPTGFEPAKWFSRWIETPVPALGGRKPEEFLDTSDGREAVSTLLAQMQSGAYS